jgi:DNA-binding beta-propeller fold protein YncE
VVKTIRTSGLINPGPLAISPDGSYALVASLTQPVILVVDIARQDVTGTIPLDRSYPTTMRISRDGTLVWIGFPYEQALEVIDIMTGVLSRGIPVTGASSIAFNPTGTLAFISTYGAPGSVVVVDTKTYAIVKTIPAGIGASNMLLSPDTGVLTVNNTTANSITLIDIVSLASKTVAVGAPPTGGLTVPVE